MILKVGTRGSRLSLKQTEIVLGKLKSLSPDLRFHIEVIKTLGDVKQEEPLYDLEDVGVFEEEINLAVMRGEVDFAVHSLKDLPVVEAPGLVIAAVPERASPHDVLVSRGNLRLRELPRGSSVGTSSLRRMAEVRYLRPDLVAKPIRGNVETRIAKVDRGEFDAVILAEAGLERMSLLNRVAERLLLDEFTPAAGQGALAAVARRDDAELVKLLRGVEDPLARAEVTAERCLLSELRGGCRVPVGAVGRVKGDTLSLYGCVYSAKGDAKLSSSAQGRIDDAEQLGRRVAQSLLEQGGESFQEEWRKLYGSR